MHSLTPDFHSAACCQHSGLSSNVSFLERPSQIDWSKTAVPKLCVLPWAVITKYCKLGGLDNRNLLFHRSGGWKSKIRVSTGQVPDDCLLAVSLCGVMGHGEERKTK